MDIICISGKAQHGKDTTATMFKEKFERAGKRVLLTHYADLLKWMCKNYFGWNGEKDDAGRTLLQRVGTDVIRKQQPDFWVNWIVNLLQLFSNEWDYVIIPDCRFPNEVETICNSFDYDCGVYHFRVHRPDFISPLSVEQQNHASETSLDFFPYDELLKNTSIEELENQIETIIRDYFDEKVD